MDVEITGTPEPKITWFKDDLPIDKAMSSEFKLAQLGICYKLIIENGLMKQKKTLLSSTVKFWISFFNSYRPRFRKIHGKG